MMNKPRTILSLLAHVRGASPVLAAGTVSLLLAACGGGTSESGGSGAASGDSAAASDGSGLLPGEPADGVDLSIDFPKPMFIGTPAKAELPNLETPGDPKLTIKVEDGTTLVSANKPVTGSDDLPVIGELSFITDGEKDGGDGFYVELGPGLQWVQIDLEAEYSVQAIALWHFHKNARAYKDVVVQVSNDPEFKEGVTTLYNNDHDNSAGMGEGANLAWIETNHGRLIPGLATKARYVRLYSNGNTTDDLNHYVEVEVYGKPAA